jgi:hypothetical protein
VVRISSGGIGAALHISVASSTATTPMKSIAPPPRLMRKRAPAMAAYDKARAGGGPSLIECLTYRHSGRFPALLTTGMQPY